RLLHGRGDPAPRAGPGSQGARPRRHRRDAAERDLGREDARGRGPLRPSADGLRGGRALGQGARADPQVAPDPGRPRPEGPGADGGAVRRELGLGAEHFLVTQIGIRSWKGNDDVLDAMAAVADRLPDARLLFVGANEAKAKILYDKAAARKIRDRVRVFLYRE